MKCPYCKEEINDNLKICPICGERILFIFKIMDKLKLLLKKINIKLLLKFLCILVVFISILLGFYFIVNKYLDTKFVNPYCRTLSKIGMRFNLENNKIVVKGFLKGSPAEKSNLKPNDIILKINNKNIENIPFSEIKYLISGKLNSKVKMQILRDGKKITVYISRKIAIKEYDPLIENQLYLDTNYLKYENEQYYIWTKTTPKNTTNYVRDLYVIDLQNKSMQFLQEDTYDKNNMLINRYDKSNFIDISPNTIAEDIYYLIKKIDEISSKKDKEKYTGYFDE